jgi:hypothetical protein
MATTIPSVDVPSGFSIPSLPAIGGSSDIPALPSLSNYLTGADQGVGTGTSSAASTTANGMSSSQLANNQATGGTGSTSVPVAGTSIWSQLGAWLASIALPGTLALVALLIVIFSVYRAVENHS